MYKKNFKNFIHIYKGNKSNRSQWIWICFHFTSIPCTCHRVKFHIQIIWPKWCMWSHNWSAPVIERTPAVRYNKQQQQQQSSFYSMNGDANKEPCTGMASTYARMSHIDRCNWNETATQHLALNVWCTLMPVPVAVAVAGRNIYGMRRTRPYINTTPSPFMLSASLLLALFVWLARAMSPPPPAHACKQTACVLCRSACVYVSVCVCSIHRTSTEYNERATGSIAIWLSIHNSVHDWTARVTHHAATRV